jgi:DNA-binding NarL/FixJ family response regulator
MRLIVIGPEGNEKLIMDLVRAGARAYLDLEASPRTVRQAIEEVTSGSIWAPRRLLSRLIDQLLAVSDASLANGPPRLTERELQVLELILSAQSNRFPSQAGRPIHRTSLFLSDGWDRTIPICFAQLAFLFLIRAWEA